MKKEFGISTIISLTFLSLGFLLIHYGLIGYGLSFFVFLPFILGYIFGESSLKAFSLYGLIFSLVVFFLLLLLGNLEGMVCILMAMPLIILPLLFGVLIKYFVKKYQKNKKNKNLIKSTVLPLCIFLIFGFAENKLRKNDKALVEIKTEIILPYSSMEVYDTIKSVDTLNTEKPFLMKLDLPIPQKCILEEEKVGAIRTCYFEEGKIIERVTAIEKGKLLRMDIIDYQLTGRRWFDFKEAIYTFEELKNGHCKMTRITTYTSQLYPRLYWQPLEKIGIEQEHEYVFNNLIKDLTNKYGG